MTSPAAGDIATDPLVQEITRWRRLASLAVVVIALAIIGGFAFERASTAAVRSSGNVLWMATAAQEAIWNAEGLVRSVYFGDDDAATRARVLAARGDSVRRVLRDLRDSVAANGLRAERIDTLIARYDTWETVFVLPARDGAPLTRTLAIAGSEAFRQLVQPLEQLVAEERDARARRYARQSATLWAVVSLALAALAITTVAVQRMTAGLRAKAEIALARQFTIEQQATELELQTQTLEEQTAQLEEQAATLEEKVAERDSTLALLEETSRFLDAAIDSSPYGIAFLDRRLRFQRINRALAATNGAPAAAHVGRSLDEMLPALAPTIRPLLERVLETGQPLENVVLDGPSPAAPAQGRRWLVTYYPIPGPRGTTSGVGCILQDVTEQHRTEQQLRQAQKLEAVGRLAGGIAHDFNNVLTVIQSYAEVLSFELEERGEGREEVDAIRAAADRAAALARQLLAFARRDVIIPRDVNVREVILGMQLILRRLVPPSVELTLDLADAPLVVRIDAGQLEQVVMNLAINAVDAMPDGGRLRIQTGAGAPLPDGRPTALIEVVDSGTGMSAEVQERLFEPFFTTKPAGRGTGLGLATTYAIVREAGGRIDVSSTLGQGSRFAVALPLSAGEEPRARHATPARGIEVAGGSERILLAEDEPAIRAALARILRGAGYDVLEAAHGGEALRLADADRRDIHLLLSDVMMPGIGGKELVQRLAVLRPEVRVVLMSGYTDDAALRADLGAARYAFLQKPFTAREVLRAIRSALDAT
jgi:PAS domain S-box-containing protein